MALAVACWLTCTALGRAAMRTIRQGGLDPAASKDVAQELRDDDAWPAFVLCAAALILISGTGHRTAVSYDGSSGKAPLRHVEYSTDGNRPPSVNAGPDQTITLPAVAPLDGAVSDDGMPNPKPAVAWSIAGTAAAY